MKKSMTQMISMALSCLLVLSLLAGCGGKTEQSAQNPPASSSQQSEAGQAAKNDPPKGQTQGQTPELPIVKEPITLTYFTGLASKVAASMKSYEEMACYKELEKRTGIKVKFQHPPVGQENEQFNLMLASRDFADIIYWNWLKVPGGPSLMIEDKSIIKLNEMIDQSAPNLKKVLSDNPEARKQSMLDDGTQFMFPFFRLDPFLRAGGPIIRKDWLDKLGLPVPKTMDEWYTMLKAFKDKDPNGNGQADEIPLVAQKGSGLESLTSFTAPFGVIQGFYASGSTVKYGPLENGYKEYITTMSKWYKEGLIDPDFAATDGKNFDAKVTGDKGGAYIGRINNTFGRYLTLMKGKNPNFDLTGAPWPTGSAGKPYNIRSDMNLIATGDGAAITSNNKYAKESVKWLDYQYSEQGHMIMNFGIEGESYKMENGYPKYTDVVMKNPNGLALTDALSRYAVSGFSGPIVQDKRYFEQTLDFPQQKNTIEIWAKDGDTSLLLPPTTATVEESRKLASIMNDVGTYVAEMHNKFIMGVTPMENYDEFVQNVKKMGIEEALKIQQSALDRYNKRK